MPPSQGYNRMGAFFCLVVRPNMSSIYRSSFSSYTGLFINSVFKKIISLLIFIVGLLK